MSIFEDKFFQAIKENNFNLKNANMYVHTVFA